MLNYFNKKNDLHIKIKLNKCSYFGDVFKNKTVECTIPHSKLIENKSLTLDIFRNRLEKEIISLMYNDFKNKCDNCVEYAKNNNMDVETVLELKLSGNNPRNYKINWDSSCEMFFHINLDFFIDNKVSKIIDMTINDIKEKEQLSSMFACIGWN